MLATYVLSTSALGCGFNRSAERDFTLRPLTRCRQLQPITYARFRRLKHCDVRILWRVYEKFLGNEVFSSHWL